ncbi:MAG: Asp-tRNA(Asn)/Glu-tRNA(Gln) amidotransferase subunit GatC [Clostridiales bacterium]|nr:Asp-tRNA(Asn)/Glu-tRNA(Gln) amidotransferase subunit GatC [Clostridiales bacterium]
MAITKDTIRQIAGLAKIGLTDEEAERFARDLSKIDTFVGQVAKLETEGVAPATHSVQMKSVYRDDVMIPSLPREELLANAPEHDGSGFLTPKVLDEG